MLFKRHYEDDPSAGVSVSLAPFNKHKQSFESRANEVSTLELVKHPGTLSALDSVLYKYSIWDAPLVRLELIVNITRIFQAT